MINQNWTIKKGKRIVEISIGTIRINKHQNQLQSELNTLLNYPFTRFQYTSQLSFSRSRYTINYLFRNSHSFLPSQKSSTVPREQNGPHMGSFCEPRTDMRLIYPSIPSRDPSKIAVIFTYLELEQTHYMLILSYFIGSYPINSLIRQSI